MVEKEFRDKKLRVKSEDALKYKIIMSLKVISNKFTGE